MDPVHQQVKHKRGSSPHQETARAPNERADRWSVEQEPKGELNSVPVSATTNPDTAGVS